MDRLEVDKAIYIYTWKRYQITALKLTLKRNHFRRATHDAGKHSGKLWKFLRVLSANEKKRTTISELNGLKDNMQMANKMNCFFVGIGPKLDILESLLDIYYSF